jgi:hypothetical protein
MARIYILYTEPRRFYCNCILHPPKMTNMDDITAERAKPNAPPPPEGQKLTAGGCQCYKEP